MFQRTVILLFFNQLLPNLVCQLQSSLPSIFVLYYIYKYGWIRRQCFIVRNTGGHLGFFQKISCCQIGNNSNFVTIIVTEYFCSLLHIQIWTDQKIFFYNEIIGGHLGFFKCQFLCTYTVYYIVISHVCGTQHTKHILFFGYSKKLPK